MGNIVNLKIFTQKKKGDNVSNNLQKGKRVAVWNSLKKKKKQNKTYSKNNKEIINKQVTTGDLANHRGK